MAPKENTPQSDDFSFLGRIVLDQPYRGILRHAESVCGGSFAWRRQKSASSHALLALAQISGRLVIRWLELSSDLRAKIEMVVRVPVRTQPGQPVQVLSRVIIALAFPERSCLDLHPGPHCVRILAPHQVWHSHVDPRESSGRTLDLGQVMPVGASAVQVLCRAYEVLTFQAVTMGDLDPASVLNPSAADWFRRHPEMLPLSDEPFFPEAGRYE